MCIRDRYKGGPQKAVDDGIIIELDPYLEGDAPNYSKLLKEHPDWDKQVKLDSGKHYTFAFLRLSLIHIWNKVTFRMRF